MSEPRAVAHAVEEEPDERYGHGMVLPGDLNAFATPGAGPSQHALILDDYIAFVPDLVVNPPGGEVLCPSHGLPILDDVHGRLSAALEEAGELDDPDFVELPPEPTDGETDEETEG